MKTELVKAKVSPEVKAAVQALATELELTESDIVRQALRKHPDVAAEIEKQLQEEPAGV